MNFKNKIACYKCGVIQEADVTINLNDKDPLKGYNHKCVSCGKQQGFYTWVKVK